jgi:hypothetical protein
LTTVLRPELSAISTGCRVAQPLIKRAIMRDRDFPFAENRGVFMGISSG